MSESNKVDQSSNDEQEASLKLFTRAEVAKHNDIKETWIIVHNSVYDVTNFLNEVNNILKKKKFI